jgi:hypothetical protein
MRAFGNALNARIEYFDKEGSDDILNAIVTQTNYAGRAIQRVVKLTETLFLSLQPLRYLGLSFLGGSQYCFGTLLNRDMRSESWLPRQTNGDKKQYRPGHRGSGTSGFSGWSTNCIKISWRPSIYSRILVCMCLPPANHKTA